MRISEPKFRSNAVHVCDVMLEYLLAYRGRENKMIDSLLCDHCAAVLNFQLNTVKRNEVSIWIIVPSTSPGRDAAIHRVRQDVV